MLAVGVAGQDAANEQHEAHDKENDSDVKRRDAAHHLTMAVSGRTAPTATAVVVVVVHPVQAQHAPGVAAVRQHQMVRLVAGPSRLGPQRFVPPPTLAPDGHGRLNGLHLLLFC